MKVNLFQVEKALLHTQYDKERLEQAIKEHLELSKFWPIESTVKVEGDRFEYCTHRLLNTIFNLEIAHNREGWRIINREEFKWLNWDAQEWVLKQSGLVAPNKFKVLSLKNIANWIKFKTDLNKLFKVENDTREHKVSIFLERMKQEGAEMKGNRGWIYSDLAEYQYEISSGGYIEEKIILRTRASIDVFKQIAALKKLPPTV